MPGFANKKEQHRRTMRFQLKNQAKEISSIVSAGALFYWKSFCTGPGHGFSSLVNIPIGLPPMPPEGKVDIKALEGRQEC